METNDTNTGAGSHAKARKNLRAAQIVGGAGAAATIGGLAGSGFVTSAAGRLACTGALGLGLAAVVAALAMVNRSAKKLEEPNVEPVAMPEPQSQAA